jgi:integrase
VQGNITRRGRNSWRLKFDLGRDPLTGKRDTKFVTVKGTKKEAQTELNRLLSGVAQGTFVDPSRVTIGDYLRIWLDEAEARVPLAAKTAERYRGLIEKQIIPRLGAMQLQKLRPNHIAAWHSVLLKEGRADNGPLSARTVGHAHRVLRKALEDATRREVIGRNPASVEPPPKVTTEEIRSLSAEDVATVLEALRDTPIFPAVVVLLVTGMRRGELLGLQWGDVDLDAGRLRIERAVEQTMAHGLRLKAPKTAKGRRRITIPAGAVEALRSHRKRQLEIRISLGLGRLPDTFPVFGNPVDGSLRDPDSLSKEWRRTVALHGLPPVTLHALRHSHASALIAGGLDVVTISRRLGHANPNVTLGVYAHAFAQSDERAADLMDAVLTSRPQNKP